MAIINRMNAIMVNRKSKISPVVEKESPIAFTNRMTSKIEKAIDRQSILYKSCSVSVNGLLMIS